MSEQIRYTGAQCPWSLYQSISHIIYIFSTVVLLIQILPSFPRVIRVTLTTIFCTFFVIVTYFLIRLTCSNPTDQLVLKFKSAENQALKDELEGKASRYCNYCRSPVTCSRSKHCMRCNRCVSIFDHHCKFVNNCVGVSNYATFIKLIISLELFEFIFFTSSSLFIAQQSQNLSSIHIPAFFILFKSLAVMGSNGYLISFHCFISRKNLTTYEYISEKLRQKGEITPEGRRSPNNKDDRSFVLNDDRSEV